MLECHCFWLKAVQLKPTSVDLLECVAQDCPSIMRKGENVFFSLDLRVSIFDSCCLLYLVTGQNGIGQNGTDKMAWTKW